MKQRTNNKIALCQNCMGSLVPSITDFCHSYCRQAKAEAQATRDLDKKKMWVYLNIAMLNLLKSEGVVPHEFSYFIPSIGVDLVGVACYDEAEIVDKIDDAMAEAYEAFWREVSGLNIGFDQGMRDDIHGHRPRVMRKMGLHSYLCDDYGISTEKNVACAIGSLTHEEGWKSPIELINTL